MTAPSRVLRQTPQGPRRRCFCADANSRGAGDVRREVGAAHGHALRHCAAAACPRAAPRLCRPKGKSALPIQHNRRYTKCAGQTPGLPRALRITMLCLAPRPALLCGKPRACLDAGEARATPTPPAWCGRASRHRVGFFPRPPVPSAQGGSHCVARSRPEPPAPHPPPRAPFKSKLQIKAAKEKIRAAATVKKTSLDALP